MEIANLLDNAQDSVRAKLQQIITACFQKNSSRNKAENLISIFTKGLVSEAIYVSDGLVKDKEKLECKSKFDKLIVFINDHKDVETHGKGSDMKVRFTWKADEIFASNKYPQQVMHDTIYTRHPFH